MLLILSLSLSRLEYSLVFQHSLLFFEIFLKSASDIFIENFLIFFFFSFPFFFSAKQGHKHVLAVPIAFTSDHIETLFEIDVESVLFVLFVVSFSLPEITSLLKTLLSLFSKLFSHSSLTLLSLFSHTDTKRKQQSLVLIFVVLKV